jgi:enediyne polyketide synthase
MIEGRDQVGPIPEDRWATHRYWDPRSGSTGPIKTYQRIAGAVGDVDFDPLAFRIPPRVVRTMDPSQRLALLAAAEAVESAGWTDSGFDRKRAAVILGNSMGGEFAKSLALRVRFREVLAALEAGGALDGLDEAQRDALFDRVERRLAAELPPVEIDSMPGLLSNVVAGRVASWLDWMGGNLTVDAACAASLAAITVATDWLRAGRCDAVLAGGVDTDLSPETYVGFSRTLALSRTHSTPFSSRADGFVMGEGCAVLALKRLDDAVRDDDRIWAVIRGVGQSSDGRGRGITAPRAEGQRLAIARAWAQAGWSGQGIGMVEAHGTGTVLGDQTEVGVLQRKFSGDGPRVWLGSVKSMLGHLKGAAGAAGLAKATLSVATGVVPPTLHAAPISPELNLSHGRLRLPRTPTHFCGEGPPRAAVSAFGFGGTNFHLVLEAGPQANRPPLADTLLARATPLMRAPELAAWQATDRPIAVHCFGAATRALLVAQIRDSRTTTAAEAAGNNWRCTIVASPNPSDEAQLRVATWVQAAAPGESLGVTAFLGSGPARQATVLVPGQGTQSAAACDMLDRLPVAARAIVQMADPDPNSSEPLQIHRSLVPIALRWGAVLDDAGLPIAAAIGHSLGEIGALVLSGQLSPKQALTLAERRGQHLQQAPRGAMLAVHTTPDSAPALAVRFGLAVAATNGPQAVVLAGSVDDVERARAALCDTTRVRVLNVKRAFHTQAMSGAARRFAQDLEHVTFKPGCPVWSGVSASPMTDPAVQLTQALTAPVNFHGAVRSAHADGARLFVEVGPGSVLSSLARSAAPDARVVPLDPDPGDGGLGLARAAAALVAEGHPGLLGSLPASICTIAFPAPPTPPRRRPTTDTGAVLATPTPPVLPVPPPEPAAQSRVPTGDVGQAVVDAVCEVTGYPAEFLDEHADLEGELGVDSIRKMEILGILEDRLGIRAREADYGLLAEADIGDLVQWAEARRSEGQESAPAIQSASLQAWTWRAEPLDIELADGPSVVHGWTIDAIAWTVLPHPMAPTVASVQQTVERWMKQARTCRERPESMSALVWDDDPASAAGAGFARSLGREWAIPVCIVSAAEGARPQDIERALASAEPNLRVTRTGITRWRPFPFSLPVRTVDTADVPPMEVLLSGGPAGIAGAVLEALPPCSVHILARRALTEDSERARGHSAAVHTLRELGHLVHWHRCDVSDEGQVETTMRLVQAAGPMDLVIHAAGALADGPANDRTIDDLQRVMAPKVRGLTHIAAQIRGEPTWLLLSSITARLGNAQQTLYGAVNAAMEAWPLPGRKLALQLTAWSGRGMASEPALLRLLAARGLTPIPPAEGGNAVAGLALCAVAGALPTTLALTGNPPPGAANLPWPLLALCPTTEGARAQIHLHPKHPLLDHHRVAGRPLVPAALWVCCMQAALGLLDRPAGGWSLERFAVHAPTFVDRPRSDVHVEVRAEFDAWHCTVWAGTTAVAEAHAHVVDETLDAQPPAPLRDGLSTSGWYAPGRLFHGPSWRVLTRHKTEIATAEADLDSSDVNGLAAAVDGAHQLISAWSGLKTGWLALPVGAGKWVLPARPAQGQLRLSTRLDASDDGVLADVRVVDATGRVVLVGERVELRNATRWLEVSDG